MTPPLPVVSPRPRGRPALGLVKKSISFPPEMLARIDEARGEEERSAFVIALVREALDQRERLAQRHARKT